jgi:hypothetical protein
MLGFGPTPVLTPTLKAIGSDLHISQKDIFLYSIQKFTELFVLSRFQAYPVARLGDT